MIIYTYGYNSNSFDHFRQIVGNTKYAIEGEIEILNLKDGVDEVLSLMDMGFNCILLCACEDVNKCHRKIIAEEIAKISGCEIVHL
jgi:DNA-binding Lrp family transcriptional regulator